MAAKKHAGGRPSLYKPETAEAICVGLASGKLLSQVCKLPGMPCVATVFLWLDKHPEFVESYARAKDIQADVIATETLEIADKSRLGKKTKMTGCVQCGASGKCPTCKGEGVKDGKGCVDCDAAGKCPKCGGRGGIRETTTGDMIERARLQVDARKWLLAKLAPKKYGDRLELAGDPNAPLVLTVAETLRQRRAKRLGEGEATVLDKTIDE